MVGSAHPDGPLGGLHVVGVEHSVAGPLCTRVLGELGARVTKVERAGAGDFARHWDAHADGEGAQFLWLNRGKDGLALDLRDREDRLRLDELLAGADVLVYNMSPAAAARLGFEAAALARTHSRLIACQISGYGASGAWSDRKAYDMLVQAEAGLMSLTGERERPARAGVSVCDVSTGIYAALLVLAAVRERDRTGRGRHLDVAMLDCALEFVAPMLTSFLNAGVSFERSARHHHAIAPYGVFRCATGLELVIAVEHDGEWLRFAHDVLELPELAADPRFATNALRLEHRTELHDAVESALLRLDRDALCGRLDRAGIAYAALNSIADLAAHPLLSERGLLVESPSAGGGTVASFGGVAARAFGRSLAGRVPPRDVL